MAEDAVPATTHLEVRLGQARDLGVGKRRRPEVGSANGRKSCASRGVLRLACGTRAEMIVCTGPGAW
jgi:hypothetical protein